MVVDENKNDGCKAEVVNKYGITTGLPPGESVTF
jgi:hypothetical protein